MCELCFIMLKESSKGRILNIDEIKGKLAFIKMVADYFIKLTRNHQWLYQ